MQEDTIGAQYENSQSDYGTLPQNLKNDEQQWPKKTAN